MDDNCIYHYNALCKNKNNSFGIRTKIMDLKNHKKFGSVIVSSLAALNNVVIAGGFKGEVMCINVDTQEVYYADYVTTSNNAITNYIQLVPYKSHYPLDASPETEMLSIISQNDNFVRIFEVPSFKIVRQYEYPWAVNHATLSPCGKLMCVAGDDDNPLIINSETGKLVASLNPLLIHSTVAAPACLEQSPTHPEPTPRLPQPPAHACQRPATRIYGGSASKAAASPAGRRRQRPPAAPPRRRSAAAAATRDGGCAGGRSRLPPLPHQLRLLLHCLDLDGPAASAHPG
jgi:hypothetical protein